MSEAPLILMVDDNRENLQVLGSTLRPNGYRLAAAQNGHKALDFARKRKPDLILLDVMMPEIDGFEVCEALQADERTRKIPVIFLTAKTQTEDIVRGFEVGGVDYVTKPFNAAELLARVRTHIRLKQAMEEIRELRDFIPICANCKNIRSDEGYWENVELYIESRIDVQFTHGICPDCMVELYPEFYAKKED